MTADNCPPEPSTPANQPTDGSNHSLYALTPNDPVGGLYGTLPVNPPAVGPGPTDPGFSIDESPPNYAGNYPRQDLTTFQEYCRSVPTFRMIQGLIFTVLANHFSDPANIEDPTLRQYVWTGNNDSSNLILNIEEDWDPKIIGRKPAIYMSRQDVIVQKLSINDQEHGGRIDGKTYHDVLLVGSHVLKCYGLTSLPPDSLGFEAGMMVARAAPAIRTWLGLSQLRVTTIGKKEKDDKDPQEAYFVPIVVPWAFWYRWIIKPSSPIINFIDISFFS